MKMNKHYNELKASYLFVDIAHKTIALTQRMEDLFITHNISTEDMALLHQETDRLTKLMEEIHSRSPEV